MLLIYIYQQGRLADSASTGAYSLPNMISAVSLCSISAASVVLACDLI